MFCYPYFSDYPVANKREAPKRPGKKLIRRLNKVGEKIESTKETIGDNVEKTGDYLDDTAITAKIKAGILGDPLLKVTQINVITTNGVVTLNGVVDSQQSIDRAMEIAQSVNEVKSIENNLVVKGS